MVAALGLCLGLGIGVDCRMGAGMDAADISNIFCGSCLEIFS